MRIGGEEGGQHDTSRPQLRQKTYVEKKKLRREIEDMIPSKRIFASCESFK